MFSISKFCPEDTLVDLSISEFYLLRSLLKRTPVYRFGDFEALALHLHALFPLGSVHPG